MTIAVVGGGIAGLAAAWELHRAGVEALLLERESRLGGKIRTIRREGFLFEAGADSFPTSKPHALALCRELGVEHELVRARPGTVYVWSGGKLHPLPRGMRLLPTRLAPLVRSGLFTTREKTRAALDLVLPGAATGADESVGQLVGRRMGRAVVDRIAAPLLAGIHAADVDRLSVATAFPPLREAEQRYGSLVRGLRARGGEATSFVTLVDGLETLVARLADAMAGVELRTQVEVTSLEATAGGWRLVLAGGSAVESQGVVLAVPSAAAARLLAPHAPRAAALLASIEWVSTAVVTLAFREADAPPLAGHGFVVARDQEARITACTWTSSKWPGRAAPGHVLLRAYLGQATDPVDLQADDATLARLACDDLARAMGLAAEPVLVDVTRWPASVPQLAVGHLARIAAIKREVGSLPPLALAGAGYEGVGISDAVGQGRRAASEVAVAAGKGVLQPEDGSKL